MGINEGWGYQVSPRIDFPSTFRAQLGLQGGKAAVLDADIPKTVPAPKSAIPQDRIHGLPDLVVLALPDDVQEQVDEDVSPHGSDDAIDGGNPR